MNYLSASNQSECAHLLAERIQKLLSSGKKVLWLVPGGSNVPISCEAMNLIRKKAQEKLGSLSVTLTDERYGPEGHKDSNWKELIDAGFDLQGINSISVLKGESLEATVKNWSKQVDALFRNADAIIGQFGIGTDGHIAGVLPYTVGAESTETAVGYEAPQFIRISLTLHAISKIHQAFVFALGESKTAVIKDLIGKNLPLKEQPAQIIKKLPEACLCGSVSRPN